MRRFTFLRRPARLALYMVLLALVTTAALLFAWQYRVDGLVLEHAIDTYSYLGTVVRTDGQILDSDLDRDLVSSEDAPVIGGPAYLEEIPESLVQWLYDRDDVARIDSRRTVSALVGRYHRSNAKTNTDGQTAKVPDTFGVHYWFLEGTVVRANAGWASDPDVGISFDTYQVRVDRMWNSPEHPAQQMVVEFYRTLEEPPMEAGQKVFLIGQQVSTGESGIANTQMTYVNTLAYLKTLLADEENVIWEGFSTLVHENAYTIIPEGADPERYIQDLLASSGLDVYLERQRRTQYTVTLLQTQDMTMIPLFAQEKGKIYEGRALDPQDQGQKVCVINQSLAYQNDLSVGDTIQLASSDVCFLDTSVSPEGRETGNPGNDDALPEYGAYEEYEIVGIYSQKNYRMGNQLYFSGNDIFIPAEPDTAAETVRPYAFSFRIYGPDYETFLKDFQPVLDRHGYSLMVEDTGWDDVKETFYTLQARRKLTLWSAGLAFAVAVAVFSVLLNAHCRYEYGLRRLLGASRREALGIYGGAFLFTALSGALMAAAAAWYTAVHPIKESLEAGVLALLPTDGQCALTLLSWAGLELLAILAAVLLMSLRNERRGLLRLIRR